MRIKLHGLLLSVFLLSSCTSAILKYEKVDDLKLNQEFDAAVKISKEAGDGGASSSAAPPQTASSLPKHQAGSAEEKSVKKASRKNLSEKKSNQKEIQLKPDTKKSQESNQSEKKQSLAQEKSNGKKKSDRTKASLKTTAGDGTKKDANEGIGNTAVGLVKREPDIEDAVGFSGRRPLLDPFRVGEVVVHNVHYFSVSAGELSFKVEPYVYVNGRKSYTFATEIKSSRTFSTFYSVDDRTETLVDYETLVPSVFALHVKESGQLREAKAHFDSEKLIANYFEKKYTKKDGEENKKLSWEIFPFSQNVFSAMFYMRLFKWDLGKEYNFRVADDGENLLFKGKALRKEVLETEIGPMPAIVIKPEIMVKGVFRPVGDIYVWLSDDDRKLILRIESKIKIGTLVSEVVRIERGQN